MSETQGKGAVIMMDALGFKEYARGKPANQILEFMEGAFELAETYVPETVTVTFLSDTVIFASCGAEAADFQAAVDSIENVCMAAAKFLYAMADLSQSSATSSSDVLNFRGALSFGEVAIRKTFLVGAAINEAAALHETADGAFVFAGPSVIQLLASIASEGGTATPRRKEITPPSLRALLRNYDVPLADGKSFETLVLNPLSIISGKPKREAERWIANSMSAFRSSDLRVMIKATNTERFLEQMLEEVFS